MDQNVKKKKKLPIWVTVVLCILLAVCVFAAAVLLFVNGKLNRISEIDQPDATPVPTDGMEEEEIFEQEEPAGELAETELEELLPEDVQWAEPSQAPEEEIIPADDPGSAVTNVLLIGQDRRPDENGRTRSDAMIIVSMNRNTGKVTLVSVMRDTYVQIEGHQDNRINTAYRFGGAKLLCDTIEKNFGVHIDGTVGVDFSGFIDVIDAVGGVDIEVTAEEAGYMNLTQEGIRVGMNTLSGEEALCYSRLRHLEGGDRMRTWRQRNVIMSLIERFKGCSVGELNALIDTVLPYVSTDLSNIEIMECALTALKMDLGDIRSYSIPIAGAYKAARIRGMAVYVPDLDKTQEALRDLLNGDAVS